MKTRRFAYRGLLILSVVIGLCLFFSGTLKTIVTPKVQFVTIQSGRLTENFRFPCALIYQETEEVFYDADDSVVISRCFVQAGDMVKEGDALFSLRFRNENEMEKRLTDAYHEALIAEMDCKREHSKIRPRQDEENYIAAYEELEKAAVEEGDARLEMERLLRPDMALPESGYPEGADKALKQAIDLWRACRDARIAAEEALQTVSERSVRDSVWAAYTQQKSIENTVTDAKNALSAFYEARDEMRSICAPHDGYIAEVSVKTGDACGGKTLLCRLTGDTGGPCLEANLSTMKRLLPEEARVTLETEWGSFESRIIATGVNQDGQKCAYVAIPQELTDMGLSLRRIAAGEIKAHIALEQNEAHSLVPVSAIHGAGANRYVYAVEESSSVLGGTEMKVKRLSVKVLAESDGMAAVAETLNRTRLAYMEDRELSDGSTVMGVQNERP